SDYLPIASSASLDAGASLTLTGPNGAKQIPLSGDDRTTLSGSGNYLSPGTYTVTGNGGTSVGKINASITIPPLPNLTSPNPNATPLVDRANGLTFTWTGGG